MTITAVFNLMTYQYDAIKAFTNRHLDKPVFCYMPERFAQSKKL